MSVLLAALLCLPGEVTHRGTIETAAQFESVARESHTRPDITATTKFLAPASVDSSLLPTVYQNVRIYPFHLEFLATEFPDRFPDLTAARYRKLVEQRATRRYFAGLIHRLEPTPGEVLYGFDFYTDAALDSELPRQEEVESLFARLSSSFTAGPLVFAPQRSAVITRARGWEGTSFDVYVPEFGVLGDFQAYVLGTAYGYVRVFTLQELLRESRGGALSWRDIVVVDEAPGDLFSPVSCVITATPQVELSHLSLRMAQRRTPNAHLAEAVDEFAPLEDRLVRVRVFAGMLEVNEVEDPREAEAWWATHRPRLPRLPTFDLSTTDLARLETLAGVDTAAETHGAKAANTARLSQALPPENTVAGFAIPFAFYERFMSENFIASAELGGLVPYDEYLAFLQEDESFRSDPIFRTFALNSFVEFAEDTGDVPPDLVAAVAEQILETFGSHRTNVRFRSSSNFEDIPQFNGAGLYESTSGCAEDSLDGDGRGPSACDPLEEDERTIERALRRVWTSLWLPRAFNERDFWQAPQERAKMGVLVTPAFVGEAANGVLLTGNPTVPGDDRYIVNVQLGEASVVDPQSGALPEKLILEVVDDEVTEVIRVRASTLAPEGEWILSDDEARRVGELAAQAALALAPARESGLGDVLLDMEFKIVEEDGQRRVVFKQARPFLRETASVDGNLALIVPAGAASCGVFVKFRDLEGEYLAKSHMIFVPGRLELPARAGSFDGDLIDELFVGPARVVAQELGPGRFEATVEAAGSRTAYFYTFRQEFLVGETPLALSLEFPVLWTDPQGEDRTELTLDEEFLSLGIELEGWLGDESPTRLLYRSCAYEFLPRFRLDVTATSGESVTLTIRHRREDGTGPANLLGARVELGGAVREQHDYWRLVYSADHHNWNRRFRVLLDPPVDDVHAVELREETIDGLEPPVFRLLGSDLDVLRELVVEDWTQLRIQDSELPEFTRGDADNDGGVGVSDAIRIIEYLFLRGRELSCADAGDANDDGRLNIADAIRILTYLFTAAGPDELPPPGAQRCGKETTEDALGCSYDVSQCF